ncbi:hypothetical protein PMAYCL1PPCAC_13740, partial [Pristionchus mayeri]
QVLIKGAYFPATMKKLSSEHIRIAYEHEWRPEESVSHDVVRLLKPKFLQETHLYVEGETVEAAVPLPPPNEHIAGWQLAKILEIEESPIRNRLHLHVIYCMEDGRNCRAKRSAGAVPEERSVCLRNPRS